MDKTIDLLINYLKENNKNLYDYSLSVGFGYDRKEAINYRNLVLERLAGAGYGLSEEELPIRQIGATIGVHTGPHPLGLGIIKRWNS